MQRSPTRRRVAFALIRAVLLWSFMAAAAYALQRLTGGPPPDHLDVRMWLSQAAEWANSLLAGNAQAIPDRDRLTSLIDDPTFVNAASAGLAAAAWLLMAWLAFATLMRYLASALTPGYAAGMPASAIDGTAGTVARAADTVRPPLPAAGVSMLVAVVVGLLIGIAFRDASLESLHDPTAPDPPAAMASDDTPATPDVSPEARADPETVDHAGAEDAPPSSPTPAARQHDAIANVETTPAPGAQQARTQQASPSTATPAPAPPGVDTVVVDGVRWRRYVVQRGDWLSKIALREFGVSERYLEFRYEDGGAIEGTHIYPSQVLLLPLDAATPGTPAAPPPVADEAAPGTTGGEVTAATAVATHAAGVQAAAAAARAPRALTAETRLSVIAHASDLQRAAQTLRVAQELRQQPITMHGVAEQTAALKGAASLAARLLLVAGLDDDGPAIVMGDAAAHAQQLHAAALIGERLYAAAVRDAEESREQPERTARAPTLALGNATTQAAALDATSQIAQGLAAASTTIAPDLVVVGSIADHAESASLAAALGTRLIASSRTPSPASTPALGGSARIETTPPPPASSAGSTRVASVPESVTPPRNATDRAPQAPEPAPTRAPSSAEASEPTLTPTTPPPAVTSESSSLIRDVGSIGSTAVRTAGNAAGDGAAAAAGAASAIPPVVAGAGVAVTLLAVVAVRQGWRMRVQRGVTTIQRTRRHQRQSGSTVDAARIVRAVDALLAQEQFGARIALVQERATGYHLWLVCEGGEDERIATAIGRLSHIADAQMTATAHPDERPLEIDLRAPPETFPEALRDRGRAALMPLGREGDRRTFLNLLGAGAVEIAGPQPGRQALLRDYLGVLRDTAPDGYRLWIDHATADIIGGDPVDVAALADLPDLAGLAVITEESPYQTTSRLRLARDMADNALAGVQVFVTVPQPQSAWVDARIRWETPAAAAASQAVAFSDQLFRDEEDEHEAPDGETGIALSLDGVEMRLTRVPVLLRTSLTFDAAPEAPAPPPPTVIAEPPPTAPGDVPDYDQADAVVIGGNGSVSSPPPGLDDSLETPAAAVSNGVPPEVDLDEPALVEPPGAANDSSSDVDAPPPADLDAEDGSGVAAELEATAASDPVAATPDGLTESRPEENDAATFIDETGAGPEAAAGTAPSLDEAMDGESGAIADKADAIEDEPETDTDEADEFAVAFYEDDEELRDAGMEPALPAEAQDMLDQRAAAVAQAAARGQSPPGTSGDTPLAERLASMTSTDTPRESDALGAEAAEKAWGDPAAIRISILGPLMVRHRRRDGSLVEIVVPHGRDRALLGLLAAHAADNPEPVMRSDLGYRAWPEITDPTARAGQLRRALSELRAALRPAHSPDRPLFETAQDSINFAQGVAQSDMAVLVSLHREAREAHARGSDALALAIWREAAALIRGPALESLSSPWAAAVRESVVEVAAEIVEEAVPLARASGFPVDDLTGALERCSGDV